MSEFVLEADGLAIGYPGHPVMQGLSFGVRPGELVGIIGPNGAGKSTLLKTLRGLLTPLGGEVRLLGRPLAAQTERDIALAVAYLQQQVNFDFGYSVREIVMTGRYPHLKCWERESARDAALVDACLAYTGVAELADKALTEISGGQRQRVLTAAFGTPIKVSVNERTGHSEVYAAAPADEGRRAALLAAILGKEGAV